MALRVAVLGTGIMGAPIAANIAEAGCEVAAWNRTPERARPVEERGATLAQTPADAARDAGVVLTMLADGDAVESVMTGEDGALAAMNDDAVWLQMSTVGVAATERLIALAQERGVAFVDAPVLGTKKPAEDGKLVVLASGPREARERCAPVFEAVAARVMDLGEAGDGTRLKLVANHWVLGLVDNVAETFGFAEGLGVDPSQFLEVVAGGNMDTPYLQMKGRAILERSFAPSFTLRLARKDVGLILEAAEREGQEARLARTVAEDFDRAIELGHGEEDMIAAYFAVSPGFPAS